MKSIALETQEAHTHTTSGQGNGASIVNGQATKAKPKTKRTSPKSPPISKEKVKLIVALHNAQHAFAVLQEACKDVIGFSVLAGLNNPSQSYIILNGFNYCEHCHNFNVDSIYINEGCEHCRKGESG